ncbi:hypothetical protein Q4O60_14510 [Aeribacillus pallidus]|nr:hypothetical protein [Aeribacillus pallidus]
MKKNILLGIFALVFFILFAIGLIQSKSSTVWMGLSAVSFMLFMFLVFKIVSNLLATK